MSKPLRVALVGPCASGKSTLAEPLRLAGYEVRQPAQEHSYVPDMWQRISSPDLLIFLDINFEQTQARRPKTHGGPEWLAVQQQRLQHARKHCDFYLDTSELTPQQVAKAVTNFLGRLPSR